MARFSWLIPIWKTETQWMDTLIQSVKNQNVTDWECNFISDGCPDEKLLWDIEKLSETDPRFRLWKRTHQGLVRALNFGLSVIDSEYIFRLDSDDYCVGQRIEKQIALMEANPDIALCGGSMCDTDGRVQYIPHCPNRLGPKTFCKIIRENKTPAFHPTWCIRRNKIDRYPDQFEHAEDIALLSIFILQRYKIGNVPEIVTAHRLHPNRTSAIYQSEQRKNAIRAIEEILGQEKED